MAPRKANGARLIQYIQDAETLAMQEGFPITSRALNQAKNALGWELADNISMADLARVGKRADEP